MANHSPRTSAQNTPDIALIIENDAVSMMRIAVDALDHAEALFIAIDDCTSRDNRTAMLRLAQIRRLAKLGRHVAADQRNVVNLGREHFLSETLPVILAATQGASHG